MPHRQGKFVATALGRPSTANPEHASPPRPIHVWQTRVVPALCPLCVFDEYTTEDRTPDGVRFGSCTNPEHGAEPFVWEVSVRSSRGRRNREGIGADLGVWDKLLTCVVPGEKAVSYGVVEDRFFARYPDEAKTLLLAYGHRWRDPQHPSSQFSMSTYLATRLSELADEGHLEKTWGPAEGPWAHNPTISWWRVPGPEPEEPPPGLETAAEEPAAQMASQTGDEVERLATAATALPPARGEYTETDFVTNLMATVLDYQMHTSTVEKAIAHYKSHRWDEIRTIDDLEERLSRHPDSQAGNTALAQEMWGNKHWTRVHQLRDLTGFFRSIGVVDQPSLGAWAQRATFNDFKGRVKGLGPAVFQWLVMRQGVDTVKPDVHVRRFAELVLGRPLGDTELVGLVTAAAVRAGVPARELDWRIWEASRGGPALGDDPIPD